MADNEDEAEHFNHGLIEQVDINSEMRKSYLDYAMSVIIGRALPDVSSTRCTTAATAPTRRSRSARA
jgi:DNA gyrase/topoisomerase IV subunit A